MMVTKASLRAMRRRAEENIHRSSRRPRNSLHAQLVKAGYDVERLCDEVERLKEEVDFLR